MDLSSATIALFAAFILAFILRLAVSSEGFVEAWCRVGTAVAVALAVVTAGHYVFVDRLGSLYESAHQSRVWDRMKQFDLVCDMYAEQHGGFFPPLDGHPALGLFPILTSQGRWQSLYPFFMNDFVLFIGRVQFDYEEIRTEPPLHTARRIADSYMWYLAHELPDEAELLRFVDAWRAHLEGPQVFIPDNYVDGRIDTRFGTFELVRSLKYGGGSVEGATELSERTATLPLLIERPARDESGRITSSAVSVLFADGHVEQIAIDAKYPATRVVLDALESLD